jgi:hypothetical protein
MRARTCEARGWWGRRLFGLAFFVLVAVTGAALSGGEAARADPVQHVWVHYDYMVGPDGESYAPDPAGIQIVVDSFKRHGVILHIDPEHTAIPLHSVIVFDAPGNPFYSFDPACTGRDAVGFSALKAQYFQPTSDHPGTTSFSGSTCRSTVSRTSRPAGPTTISQPSLTSSATPATQSSPVTTSS